MKGIKVRNANTLTEAGYWSMLRSLLRKGFQFWKPARKAKNLARKKMMNPNGNGKVIYMYQCAVCGYYYTDKASQIDHIDGLGTLLSLDDLAGFVERLSVEDMKAFQCVCKECHQMKTNEERRAKKIANSNQMGFPFLD